MMKHKLFQKVMGISLAASISAAMLPVAFAQSQVQVDTYTTPGDTSTIEQRTYVLPAGTALALRDPGMGTMTTGGAFTVELASPIRAAGVVVIPAGSTVHGQASAAATGAETRYIQLNRIVTPSGVSIPFQTMALAEQPAMISAVREVPLEGRIQTEDRGLTTLYPRVSIGPTAMSPAAKIVSGTLAGGALGAGIGTLTGLTMKATDTDGYNISHGSATARGLAWGAVYGAGFGLLSGLIAAAVTPDPVAVTTTRTSAVRQHVGDTFNVILEEPVTLHF